MRIDKLLQKGLPSCSFEFSPPRDDTGFEQLYKTIDRLKTLHPSHVSVTYGAGGSTRRKTVEISGRIQNEIGLRCMAHLTCVGHTRDEIVEITDSLYDSGIRNILALRGDPPQSERWFTPTENGFANSSELISYLRNRYPDLCIGVGGYPEGHPECLNLTRDLEHLKRKIENGGNLIITQLFFDNEVFRRWRDQARAMGIDAPVIAGIMPIKNVPQIKRFVTRCGAKIPQPLLKKIESAEGDDDAVYRIGVDHAIAQCRDLLSDGAVEGVHFYTLNLSRATVDICRSLDTKFVS